jgi:hypothetical protein
MVIFGVYSRQFVAFPLFAVNTRTILAARYPEALIDRMVRAEQERRIRKQEEYIPRPIRPMKSRKQGDQPRKKKRICGAYDLGHGWSKGVVVDLSDAYSNPGPAGRSPASGLQGGVPWDK